MKLRAQTLALSARLAAVAIFANIALVACMPSSEGEMSDDEKLKTMNKGRADYMQGRQNPGAASSTTGK